MYLGFNSSNLQVCELDEASRVLKLGTRILESVESMYLDEHTQSREMLRMTTASLPQRSVWGFRYNVTAICLGVNEHKPWKEAL